MLFSYFAGSLAIFRRATWRQVIGRGESVSSTSAAQNCTSHVSKASFTKKYGHGIWELGSGICGSGGMGRGGVSGSAGWHIYLIIIFLVPFVFLLSYISGRDYPGTIGLRCKKGFLGSILVPGYEGRSLEGLSLEILSCMDEGLEWRSCFTMLRWLVKVGFDWNCWPSCYCHGRGKNDQRGQDGGEGRCG